MIELIDKIQETEEMCELDTMATILESYIKLFNVVDELNYDETIIQESGIFDSCIMMESDTDTKNSKNDNDKESFFTKIKNMISNIIGMFKKAIDKLVNIVTRKIFAGKEFLYMLANSFAILGELSGVKSTYKESYDEEISDDVNIVQEGIGDSLRFASADARIARAKREQEKQKQKDAKMEQNAIKEEMIKLEKQLNERYKNEITQRLLTHKQVEDIVSQISSRYPSKELGLINDAIRKLQSDSGAAMSETTKKNVGFCDRIIKLEIDNNKDLLDSKIQHVKEDKTQRTSERDVMMRIDLIEKFSDTLGKAMNEMSDTKHFSHEAMMNCMYTGQPIKNMFVQIASWAGYMIKNQTKCIKAGDSLKALAAKQGKQLYEGNIKFDDEVFKDTQKRRELNMKVNKTANVTLFTINQIKEETYGWADDRKFNYQTYHFHNPITGMLGGPFTIAMKLAKIALCLAIGKPVIAVYSLKQVAKFVGTQFGLTWASPLAIAAKSLNPDGYRIEREREKSENAPTVPTVSQRVGGFLM